MQIQISVWRVEVVVESRTKLGVGKQVDLQSLGRQSVLKINKNAQNFVGSELTHFTSHIIAQYFYKLRVFINSKENHKLGELFQILCPVYKLQDNPQILIDKLTEVFILHHLRCISRPQAKAKFKEPFQSVLPKVLSVYAPFDKL